MLLIGRRRRPAGAANNGQAPDEPGHEPGPGWSALIQDWRRLDRRQTAVVLAAAVTAAAAPPMLLAPGSPLAVSVSLGAQIVLVPLAGLLWWRWRRAEFRGLALLLAVLAGAWTMSVVTMALTLVMPGAQALVAGVQSAASIATNVLGTLVMAWLCRGRGWRLGLVRVGQGMGLLGLLAACCWVLLLGSGEVITALPTGSRVVALLYLLNYLVSLCLGWYALFRHRRAGVPGLGLLVLAQAIGGGVTTLVIVRALAGHPFFGSPLELGWVISAALGLSAAAARRVPALAWERNRQRIVLVGVLLFAAGSMAQGVARFVDQAAVGVQAQHQRSEWLRRAFESVQSLSMLPVHTGTFEGGNATLDAYRAQTRAYAAEARGELRQAMEQSRRQGAGAAELARMEMLVDRVDEYERALLRADGIPDPVTAGQASSLLRGLAAAADESDSGLEAELAEMRRITDLLQLAVPLGLLVAGLTFVSSWTTLARRERRVEAAEARKQLTKAVVNAQERERGRIAADLHDGPLQQVAAWRIKVEMVLRKLDRDLPQARELLASLDQEVAQQSIELRRLMHALRPPVLDELGLEAAVGMLARDTATRAGVEITLEAGLNGVRCTPEVETLAYRIVQEGLNNVAKHAAATQAVVSLQAADAGLVVRIADNGRGMREFEPDRLVKDGHFGLAGIGERVEIVGGRLVVVTAGGEGTVLEARLPAGLEAAGDSHEE
jgi:signal transduction histidine kinase